jgi:hypothetical protein
MSTDEAEIWVVRDEITSPPSRAVSLRKLRRGVKLGKLRLEYEVARVGTDRWMTLAELFDSRKPKPVVLTESSVVTSAPNRATSEEEAARVLERPHRPRLRRIHQASASTPASESEPLELTADDVLSDPDLDDVDDDEIDVVATSQLPKVIVDGSFEDPLPLVTTSPDATPTPAAPEALGDATPLLAAPVEEPEPETARPQVPVPALAPPDTPASVFSSPPPSVRAAAPTLYTREASGGVTVTAIDLPFFALVRLMIKVAFASVPALVLLSVVLSLVLFGLRMLAAAAGLGAR